MIIEEPKLIVP